MPKEVKNPTALRRNAETPQAGSADPARDDRFDVRERWKDLDNFPSGTDEHQLEFFHRQMNEEANVMENAAQCLVDFAHLDWEIRMGLARQCSDEARHVLAYLRIMKERGVRIGQYPVLNFQYRILQKIDTLVGRLAVENRTFEADGLDAATFGVASAKAAGDEVLAELMDGQQADEILHVGFANKWIREQVAENPRNWLSISRALSMAMQAFEHVFEGGAHRVQYPVAARERREAGFEVEEITVATKAAESLRAKAVERSA